MEIRTTNSEDQLFSGLLEYQEKEYQFIFSEGSLRLISTSADERAGMWKMGKTEISPGVYTWGEPPRIKQDHLIGKCFENGKKIIFIPKRDERISCRNSVMFIPLEAYIVCNTDEEEIDRINFSSYEIDCIYPVNQAVCYKYNADDFFEKGKFGVETKEFEETSSDKEEFTFEEKLITAYFGISRNLNTGIWDPPITLCSNLMLEFKATNDYRYILELCYLAKQFVQFLCYRKNVSFTKIQLSAPRENNKHDIFATLVMLPMETDKIELEPLKKGMCIRQAYISGYMGKILEDIGNNKLYLRNLPDTYESGLHINAARFIMITAAFEWEFGRLYPEGVKKSLKQIEAEEKAAEKLEQLINQTTGKEKEIYKRFKKILSSGTSMATKIITVGTDLGEIVDPFGKYLYSLNSETLDYSAMGNRLADQRNHYAHGDLDKDFIGLSLLDLMFLERIIYAMQLKICGVTKKKIQKSVNDLFHCNFSIE